MDFRTLDDVIAYDDRLSRQIDVLGRRLSDEASLPRLSNNVRRSLGQQRRNLIRRRQEHRTEFSLHGHRDRWPR